MDRSVTASDANRNFSELLRQAEQGEKIAITRHGRVVAMLSPPATDQREQEQERARRRKAFDALMARWESQPVMNIGPWTRDELYD